MKILINFIFKIFLILSSKYKIKFLNKIIRIFNDKDKNYFFTYNYRKKYFKKNKKISKNDISIIIQGPIIRKNEFTINSIKLYLENCNSLIILSTWKNELSNNEIRNLKKMGVKVLINKYPETRGPKNLNYQILSTLNAIKFAKLKGKKFVIKTRTDFRIYLDMFDLKIFKFFHNLKKTNKFIKIGSSDFTLKNRLFSVSEILMFGNLDDLSKYFFRLYSEKEFLSFDLFVKKQKKEKTFLDDSYTCFPENFLCYNYLKFFFKEKVNYNSKNYFNVLKKYFVIIDNSYLDIFWYKYNHQYEYPEKNFTLNSKAISFKFSDWLNL